MKWVVVCVFLLHFFDIGTCLNFGCFEDTSVLFQNLSLEKPANQSSVFQGLHDDGPAWKANDGNKNPNFGAGSCSHTDSILDNHWWQVDLQGIYSIISVAIVNRNSYAYRLHDFGIEVSLSDEDDGNGRLKGATLCHHHNGAGIAASEERTFPCTAVAVGRFVRIYKPSWTDSRDVLTMCEVEVSGYKMDCDSANTTFSTISSVTVQSPQTTHDVTSPPIPATTEGISTSSLIPNDMASPSSATISDDTTSPETSDVVNMSSLPSTDLGLIQSAESIPCNCRCVNITAPTMSELMERVDEIKKQLAVSKQATSSYRRKLISAPDSRLSAKGIGYVLGVGVLVSVCLSIMAMDLPLLIQFVTSLHKK